MTNTPPTWPHGAPPPGGQAFPPLRSGAQRPVPTLQASSPFQPLAPPVGPRPDQTFDAAGQPGPLGSVPPASASIDQFRPPKSRLPFWIAIATALALAGLVAAAIFLSGRPAPIGASATPTPTTAPTSSRTPMRSGQGLPFESTADRASGFWEIRQQTWQSDGVLLQLAVTVDKGSLTPTFYVFNNDTAEQYRIVLTDAPEPRFPGGLLGTGSTSVGNVFVTMPHAEGTLIMTSTSQREAISALPIQK